MCGLWYLYRPQSTRHENKSKAPLWHSVLHRIDSAHIVEVPQLGQLFNERCERRSISSLQARNILDENQLRLEMLNEAEKIQQ
jgi:hypothetical protein